MWMKNSLLKFNIKINLPINREVQPIILLGQYLYWMFLTNMVSIFPFIILCAVGFLDTSEIWRAHWRNQLNQYWSPGTQHRNTDVWTFVRRSAGSRPLSRKVRPIFGRQKRQRWSDRLAIVPPSKPCQF